MMQLAACAAETKEFNVRQSLIAALRIDRLETHHDLAARKIEFNYDIATR